MKRKVVLFVIGPRGFPDVQGGIERFSENLYPALQGKGYDITVFTLRRFSAYRQWKGVNFIRIAAPSAKILEKPVYNLIAAIYCIFKRPDIIHIHSIASGMIINLLKLFGLTVVARYNSQDYLHTKWNFLGRLVLRNSEKQFMSADYIITNNRAYFRHLIARGRKSNISVVPNGVEKNDPEKYSSQLSKYFSNGFAQKKFLLFVGRITPEKNIETLIMAFQLLNRDDLALVIAGDTAHDDGYFMELKNRYPDKSVFYTGKLDRERLNCLYSNCELFIIPSFSEGAPNVLLEAMSFNCRVLASRISAHLEFEFDESSYFDPENKVELRDKILQKISSGSKEDHTARISPHNWEGIVDHVHDIHREMLKGEMA